MNEENYDETEIEEETAFLREAALMKSIEKLNKIHNLETYCLRLFMAIKNGLSLFLVDAKNDRVKTVYQTADGLEAIIEFEGKDYKIRIIPL